MNCSLVVLAAGMGSRYGGLKQLDGVGPGGQTIMDYSIHDAIEAGFDEIVFVIRRDFESDFEDKILSKYKGKIVCKVAFQDMTACTEGIRKDIVDSREKPWGTGHATLVAKDVISGPFAVINADDFYGRDAFDKMIGFLRNDCESAVYSMIGYQLDKTLSDNGTVNRGVCTVENGVLTNIVEGLKIQKVDGEYKDETPDAELNLNSNTLVSMNFFGFHPSINEYMAKEFVEFGNDSEGKTKAEYFIPLVIDNMMKKDLAQVKVIPTDADWIGVTYQEDKPDVMAKLQEYTNQGFYASEF